MTGLRCVRHSITKRRLDCLAFADSGIACRMYITEVLVLVLDERMLATHISRPWTTTDDLSTNMNIRRRRLVSVRACGLKIHPHRSQESTNFHCCAKSN